MGGWSETDLLIRDAVREFVDKEIRPNIDALEEAAKAQWALEKQKGPTDVPTGQDLAPYFKDGVLPVCPDGGTYTINAIGALPTCSVPGPSNVPGTRE